MNEHISFAMTLLQRETAAVEKWREKSFFSAYSPKNCKIRGKSTRLVSKSVRRFFAFQAIAEFLDFHPSGEMISLIALPPLSHLLSDPSEPRLLGLLRARQLRCPPPQPFRILHDGRSTINECDCADRPIPVATLFALLQELSRNNGARE
ncbi:hypothetical protein NZK35_26205 [Stieleria sp. ICT_E10.1]|uniref:hypothetical protein n=1 Tax=Stieleria sedimenti TaxID=2976331 RepID=UPI002180770B|nr:hypothetical protein [Stieleria sedimenti]MCS7470154.1 hypothetical protein [Stieleria sedimenti]